jgi:hypothetical protein
VTLKRNRNSVQNANASIAATRLVRIMHQFHPLCQIHNYLQLYIAIRN